MNVKSTTVYYTIIMILDFDSSRGNTAGRQAERRIRPFGVRLASTPGENECASAKGAYTLPGCP